MDQNGKVRWLLVDNHSSVTETLPQAIDQRGIGLEHADPVAMDAQSALRRIEEESPDIDVVLLDLQIPKVPRDLFKDESREHGWRCAADISTNYPMVKIVILSFNKPDPASITDQRGLFELGGPMYLSGYISKDAKPSMIATAIRQVMDQGTPYFPQEIYRLLMQTHDNAKVSVEKTTNGFKFGDPCAHFLTSRLHAVMLGVARGLTNQEIARALVLSDRTVEAYITRCCERLHLEPATKPVLSGWASRNCLEVQLHNSSTTQDGW